MTVKEGLPTRFLFSFNLLLGLYDRVLGILRHCAAPSIDTESNGESRVYHHARDAPVRGRRYTECDECGTRKPQIGVKEGVKSLKPTEELRDLSLFHDLLLFEVGTILFVRSIS